MSLEKHITDMLQYLDPNPGRVELESTPKRVAEALNFLTQGHEIDINKTFEHALFETNDQSMIVVKNIEFYSLCEHHLLPFFGQCHIAYMPKKHILGFSKIAEVVNIFSRRLQIQERLTLDIAQCIQTHLEALGVGIIMEAKHLCMSMRGIEKQNPRLITQKMLGGLENPVQQQLFFKLIQDTHQNPMIPQLDD